MSQQRAEEEITKRIQEAFEAMDKDGSGKVSSMELREFCKRIPEMESIAECLCEIDTSDDGQISLEELTTFITTKAPKDKIKESHLKHLFKQVDADGSGSINKAELSALLLQFDYTQEEIDKMMADIGGGDGKITSDEFITAFRSSC